MSKLGTVLVLGGVLRTFAGCGGGGEAVQRQKQMYRAQELLQEYTGNGSSVRF